MKTKNQKRIEAIERMEESIAMQKRSIEIIEQTSTYNEWNNEERKAKRIKNIQSSILAKEIDIERTRNNITSY
jgi:hypothetical protein